MNTQQLLDHLASQQASESQLARMKAIGDLCRGTNYCTGLALVGSFARGSGDGISDLDLAAFVPKPSAEKFFMLADRILTDAQPLYKYSVSRPGEVAMGKYIYRDFTSLEFHVLETPTAFRLRRPYIAVWDPIDFISSLVVDGEPPKHEDFPAFPHGDAGLPWELLECMKWCIRGRQELAKRHLRKLGMVLGIQDENSVRQ